MSVLCWLFGHKWRVAQPLWFVPFDQGGVHCIRCYKHYGVHTEEARQIAAKHNL